MKHHPMMVMLAAVILCTAATWARAGDDGDWEVADTPQEEPAVPAPQAPAHDLAAPEATAPSRSTIVNACGEKAIAASPEVRAIVAEINHVWHSNVQVYQSVQASGPHARPGGCIFYHPGFMSGLLNGWMNIKEAREVKPMVYAIFAHEVGHEVHNDFSPARMNISSAERELEADRFAGYTMSFLRIQPDDIVTYYALTGDDFTGGGNGKDAHGSSEQRSDAFEYGWKLAEAGSSEQSVIPATGLGHP